MTVARPRQCPAYSPLTSEKIASACYVGSAEHKVQRWWGGMPQAYQDAAGRASRPKKQNTTICPLVTEADRNLASAWVRAALATGNFKRHDGDKDFPALIWYHDPEGGRTWEGRCINGILGEYKGWPITEEERREIFG